MNDGRFYQIRAGECVSSIAKKNGLFWETIWNDSQNAELKRLRKDPNVLMAGDVLFVPFIRTKEIAGDTDQKHRFRYKGVPAKARYQFKDELGEPIADVAYTLDIDGIVSPGTTDAEGRVEVAIPPDAEKGLLTLKDGDFEETYTLQLGDMDPASEPVGARKRLNNLGYECAKNDPVALEKALRTFQTNNGLAVTGELDDVTQKEILKQHGC